MASVSNGQAAIKQPHVAHFNLKLNGSQAPKEVMIDLLECIIENSVNLPDVCTIRMHDHHFRWLDSEKFEEGVRVEVLGGMGKNDLKPLFDGEIVGLEMDLAAHGVSTLVVRCFDRSHRLHRGRQARTFVQVKDSDIVKKVGQELGFNVIAEETGQVHDWVLQNNQTNWEFLNDRAARNGFRLYVQGHKDLRFEKVKNKGAGVVKLEWGTDLKSFRPRTSASGQVSEVIVKGWDPKSKQKIEAKATKPSGIPKVGRAGHGGDIAKKAFGEAKMVVVDRPVHSNAEAQALAQSICDEMAGAFLEADGLCEANPSLKPGMSVEIKNIGNRFSGEYLVTSTIHTYTPAEGYQTQFVVSGKSAHNLISLIGGGSGGNGMAKRSHLGGNVVVGVVTDNKDPEGLCRVKVKYPWLTEDHTSFWARQSSQMAGSGRGMFNIPEIGDEVLVAFEHGEVTRPFVLGQLWNTVDRPPTTGGNPMHGAGSVTNRRGFYSRVGHKMDFDDTGGGGIKLTTTGGIKVHCTDDGPTILCSTPGGQSITITDAGSLIKLQDNAGDVITMSNGTITATATTMMNLNAPMINISGTISVTINGMAIAIDAGAMATMNSGAFTGMTSGNAVYIGAGAGLRAEAGAKAEIQGKAGLELDGTTGVEVKGAIIKLN